jgi:hypothetical protein
MSLHPHTLKPSGPPATRWPRWRRTGCKDAPPWNGTSAMASASRTCGCPETRQTGRPMPRWWGKMASTSWTRWRLPRFPRRSGSYRSCRACVGPGSVTTSGPWTRPEQTGVAPSTACDLRRTVNYHQRLRVLNRRTMPTRATAINGTRPGPAIWCMSAKRASPLPPTPHARPHDLSQRS